jgi:hypothetical protein
MFNPEEIEVSDVHHLTIVRAFAERIDLVNTMNQLVPGNMEVDRGTVVLAMVNGSSRTLARVGIDPDAAFVTRDNLRLAAATTDPNASKPRA